jgi:predicted Zn-dependent protease
MDVVRVPAEQTLVAYLTPAGSEHRPEERRRDHDQRTPAATATAKGDQWVFRLYAVRFGSDVYRFIFAGKRMSAEVDHVFREAVASFRRMTIAEIQAAKPLHLRVVTVAPDDTVERLAARMATPDRNLERFRILNWARCR